MTEQPRKTTLWRIFSTLLLLVAAGLLLWGLYRVRLSRSALFGTDLFSPEFLALFGAALLLVIASFAVLSRQRLVAALQARPLLWSAGSILLSIIAVILATDVIALLRPYSGPILIWVFLWNLALGGTAFAEHVQGEGFTKLLQNLALMSLTIIVPILLLEVGLRVYFGVFGSEQQRIAYLYSVDEALALTNRYIGLPYVNYGLAPEHPEHNSLGYRGAEFAVPRPSGTFRIFTLGGSTTYGTGVTTDETYPAQLQRILREEYGYTNVEVVNAGVEAYASHDSLANLTYHVLDHDPNLVIVYHGINDVRARLVDPKVYSGLNLQRGIWSPERLQNRISPSVLLRFVGIQLGVAPNPLLWETQLATPASVVRCGLEDRECRPLELTQAEVIAANPPLYFERNLRNMAAIAQANDALILFSTWAYSAADTELPNFMQNENLQAAVAEQNDLILALAAELDVPAVDVAASMPADAAFWQDGMHMTPAGTEEQAAQYAAFLHENELLPQSTAD